jgi:hypothetical protein
MREPEALAAYQPLPEDSVMPASEELAYTDAPTCAPNLTPAI